jgi:hypothetical protein
VLLSADLTYRAIQLLFRRFSIGETPSCADTMMRCVYRSSGITISSISVIVRVTCFIQSRSKVHQNAFLSCCSIFLGSKFDSNWLVRSCTLCVLNDKAVLSCVEDKQFEFVVEQVKFLFSVEQVKKNIHLFIDVKTHLELYNDRYLMSIIVREYDE